MTRAGVDPLLRDLQHAPALGRRRHPRYGQSGTVELRSVVTGPAFAGILFEIARGGCLVWMHAATSARIDELVELRLACGSESIRVMGTIRYLQEDRRLLGIAFERLSEDDSRSLERLMLRLQAAEVAELAARLL